MTADAMNNTSKIDWARIDTMTDDEIDRVFLSGMSVLGLFLLEGCVT